MKTSSPVILGSAFVFVARATLAAPLPPVTGTVASNRLGEEQVEFLQAADHTQVRMNHITPGDGTSQHMTSGYVIQTDRRGSKFSQQLANILLNDKTYASAPDFQDASGHSQNFLPTFSFRIYDTADDVSFMDVSVDPSAQELCVTAPCAEREHHPMELYANYTLLAPQLTALIKEAFPSSPQAQAIKAWPAYVKPIPASIPASIQAQIATLRPGMTRADVLKLFGTEGGLSTRFQRTYVYQGATVPEIVTVQEIGQTEPAKTMTVGQLIKVDVQFMPKGAHLQWIHGEGILIDPQELYRFDGLGEAADDVIVRISRPYLGFSIVD